MDETKSNLVILEVAERIFFQYGYSNTSMEEIANECGMSKKTLYKYFKSKEGILLECVKRRIDYNSNHPCSYKRLSTVLCLIKFFEAI